MAARGMADHALARSCMMTDGLRRARPNKQRGDHKERLCRCARPGWTGRGYPGALAGGYDEAGLADALAAGDVRRDQLRLDLWPLAPA